MAYIAAAASERFKRDSSRESLESFLEICAHHRPQTDDLHQISSLEEIWWNASSPLLLEDPTETLRENRWRASLKYARIIGHRPMMCTKSLHSKDAGGMHRRRCCWKIQARILAKIKFLRSKKSSCIICRPAGRFNRDSSREPAEDRP